MTAVEHIVAWIESSRPHYARLLEIERHRKFVVQTAPAQAANARNAANLAADAYREMIRGGDALRSDPYSASEILDAAKALLAWEAE